MLYFDLCNQSRPGASGIRTPKIRKNSGKLKLSETIWRKWCTYFLYIFGHKSKTLANIKIVLICIWSPFIWNPTWHYYLNLTSNPNSIWFPTPLFLINPLPKRRRYSIYLYIFFYFFCVYVTWFLRHQGTNWNDSFSYERVCPQCGSIQVSSFG